MVEEGLHDGRGPSKTEERLSGTAKSRCAVPPLSSKHTESSRVSSLIRRMRRCLNIALLLSTLGALDGTLFVPAVTRVSSKVTTSGSFAMYKEDLSPCQCRLVLIRVEAKPALSSHISDVWWSKVGERREPSQEV